MVGPGRGSAAGSIVAYTLRITDIDPIKYGLIFERFLNPERVSMPDIDIDFCYERRGEVIDYVTRKYGEDKVSQIITFGTMKAKQAVRDVGRVLNVSYPQTDAIAKAIPFALKMTIDKALEMNPELKEQYESDETVHRVIDMAKAIEGMPRHASTHAAGVVISKDSIDEYVPLYLADKGLSTQFNMTMVSGLTFSFFCKRFSAHSSWFRRSSVKPSSTRARKSQVLSPPGGGRVSVVSLIQV